ncbi:GIY-YIG nuclease family protein [Streptomyces sp. NPDC015346]|uniref:GIY-YIG nuclease family protein n=1 Tax=Streptomyces sp. NPDC015346 TaxID=3364954 RepID=UPI0036FC9F89
MQVSAAVTDLLHANALASTADLLDADTTDIDEAQIAEEEVWSQSSHTPVVYFMTNGDRIKIGVSTNITARVAALSLRRSNVLLLLNGDFLLESSLHKAFTSDRIADTEWFVYSARIRDFVTRKHQALQSLRQPSPTQTIPAQQPQTAADRRHPRRTEITELVRRAGGAGMTVNDVRRRIAAAYPGETPPSDTAIQNWYAAHPNITKPGRAVYFWTDTPDQTTE